MCMRPKRPPHRRRKLRRETEVREPVVRRGALGGLVFPWPNVLNSRSRSNSAVRLPAESFIALTSGRGGCFSLQVYNEQWRQYVVSYVIIFVAVTWVFFSVLILLNIHVKLPLEFRNKEHGHTGTATWARFQLAGECFRNWHPTFIVRYISLSTTNMLWSTLSAMFLRPIEAYFLSLFVPRLRVVFRVARCCETMLCQK